MKVLRTANALNAYLRAERLVHQAEHRLAGPKVKKAAKCGPRDWLAFKTQAPRGAEYCATPPPFVIHFIEELGLPSSHHFADLGSGLGLVCFVAALHFDKVVGFELDPRIHAEAEKIRQTLEMENITFRREDFLGAGLGGFDVLYVFHPFHNKFIRHMVDKMKEVRPGAIVVSAVFNYARPVIFREPFFREILRPTDPMVNDPYLSEFYAYERR